MIDTVSVSTNGTAATIAAYSGIRLDIGCGAHKQPSFVGMDIRPLPGVDIVHDINVHPWPIDDETVLVAMASHLVEHIPPMAIIDGRTHMMFIEFMDEVWRVLKVGGEFAMALPHGNSQGYLQDPTHCNACNEHTWMYFDPENGGILYPIYNPKPWNIKFLSYNPAANMEVVLVKRADDPAYHQ